MKTIAASIVCLAAALAAAGFAWQRNQALEATKAELAGANSQLQKAKSDIGSLAAELEALRKESAEQKMAAEQLRAEVTTAKAFLEAEKGLALRLREELAKAQLAGRPRAAPPAPARVQPSVVPAQPTAIRTGPAGSAVGAGAPAR
jgi:peptidoglycan hydrolase CwlO-like protein